MAPSTGASAGVAVSWRLHLVVVRTTTAASTVGGLPQFASTSSDRVSHRTADMLCEGLPASAAEHLL